MIWDESIQWFAAFSTFHPHDAPFFIFLLCIVVSQPAASSPSPVAASSNEEGKGESAKPKKNRCFMCRKRVGLTGKHSSWYSKIAAFKSVFFFFSCLMLWFKLCPFVPLGFDCRCGNLFCGIHRYSDKHNCPYDYKAEAAAKIRKENPVVVADKIQRI